MSEKIEPCPYCEESCRTQEIWGDPNCPSQVVCSSCDYRTPFFDSRNEAIDKHNKLCRDARMGKAAQELIEKPPLMKNVLGDDWGDWCDGYNNAIDMIVSRLKAAAGDEDES